MQAPFSLSRRNHYPWLFIGLSLAAAIPVIRFYPGNPSPELLLSVIGAVAAFTHFLYSQHNQNTKQFIELFREFNARYDRFNEGLNAIVLNDGTSLLSFDNKQLLYDYFNLCAEEYLYFRAGYIDEMVWQAWLLGMGNFVSNPRIRNLWEEELKSGSYYGFTLDLIDEAVKKKQLSAQTQRS